MILPSVEIAVFKLFSLNYSSHMSVLEGMRNFRK